MSFAGAKEAQDTSTNYRITKYILSGQKMCIEMSLTFRIPPLCESERERLGAGVNKMLHIPFHVNTEMKILMHPF